MKKTFYFILVSVLVVASCKKDESNPVAADKIPLAPTLAAPNDTSSNIAVPVILVWNESNGAASYTLQVATDSSFSSLVYSQKGITATSQQIPLLDFLSPYYWRVNATNSVGTSGWSSVRSFTTGALPLIKPLSAGPVRITNKKLEVDYDGDGVYEPYYVKGAAYSITPIGDKPITSTLEDRGIQYLKYMNANTIRTYGIPGKTMLTKMAAQNIRVIAGFWVETSYDLSLLETRQKVKDDFAKMVIDLKDNPGVLIWNLGNEQNYVNGNNANWYALCQELAIVAYQIEGEKYHPVCISNGNIYNIGDVAKNADDASLTYIDLWATNIYELNLTPQFVTYKSKSNKPLVITEYGIDALDDRIKQEYETTQAVVDSMNWSQILAASEFVVGATVFEYTDEWWKADDPTSHDYGGYATGAHPDGYSNEEWWGLIAVTPDQNGDGYDEWRPRQVYYMFKRNWK